MHSTCLYKCLFQTLKTEIAQMSSRFSTSKPKPLFFFLIFIFLFLLTFSCRPKINSGDTIRHQNEVNYPNWFDLIKQKINGKKIKIGLINIDEYMLNIVDDGLVEMVDVNFAPVGKDLKWENFFPEWIDEDGKWDKPKCPDVPMPTRMEEYGDLDVIVARVPCGGGKRREGIRDVFRLQVNLVVANLVVNSGWIQREFERPVYVVFIGSCGPMMEIFRCEDVLMHRDEYWVYKPELRRLKHKVLMPFGSCQLATSFAETGKEVWRDIMSHPTLKKLNLTSNYPRQAYATILHSSEAYVCGAIVLAQSIRLSNSTKDLILLADESITSKSRRGLRAAGWKIKNIQRIRNPNAEKDSYNEWNYSKLRLWQLTSYDKILFLDADLLVIKNMDELFVHPQLSVAANDKVLFNSGVMIVEPSECMFEELMLKTYELDSYNGGDQGFLNEAFTWWHRLSSKKNYLKMYIQKEGKKKHEIPNGIYAIHYLGLKPWMCYRDYDCNWDMLNHHTFASDSAHSKWWQVYDAMPEKLQPYCALTRKMENRIKKWREIAENSSLVDGHWKIKVRDPRQHLFNGL